MSLVSKALKGRRGSGGSNNPLRVLGLSSRLLIIGLSEDDIFDIAQIMAKRILGRIHSDISGVDSEDLRSIIEAMKLLQERSNFDKALDELKNERSHVAGEMANTLELMREKNDIISELRTKLDRIQRGNESKAPAANSLACIQMNAMGLNIIDAGDVQNLACRPRILVADLRVGKTLKPKQVDAQTLRKRFERDMRNLNYVDKHYLAKHNEAIARLRSSFKNTNLSTSMIGPLIDDAIRWDLQEIHWDQRIASRKAGLGDMSASLGGPSETTAVIPATTKRMDAFRQSLSGIRKLAEPKYFDELHIVPMEYSVHEGLIQIIHGTWTTDLALIGCVDPSTSEQIIGKFKTDDMRLLADETWLLEHLRPFLWVGGLIAAVETENFSPDSTKDAGMTFLKLLKKTRKVYLPGIVYGFD